MPRYRVETNQGVFEVEANRPPTADEVAQHMASPAPAQSPAAPGGGSMAGAIGAALGGVVGAASRGMNRTREGLADRGWENLQPAERAALMGLSYPEHLGREVAGIERGAEGMALRSVPPAVGQALGRMTRIPGADRALGAAGGAGGEIAARLREGQDVGIGDALAGAINGLTRGGSIRNASPMAAAKELGTQAGSNVLAQGADVVLDEGRLPTAMEVGLAAATGAGGSLLPSKDVKFPSHLTDAERRNLAAAMERGLKVAPVEVSPTLRNRVENSVAGSAALKNELKESNLRRGNELSAQQLGISGDVTDPAIKARVTEFSEPMRVIARQGPDAAAALDLTRTARDMEREAWRVHRVNPTNDSLKAARVASLESEQAEALLAQTVGPELYGQYVNARRNVAQALDVKDALNPTDSNVDMRVFGQMARDRQPLSGNLEAMGNFAGSRIGSRYVGNTSSTPGVSALNPAMTVEIATESGGGPAQGLLAAMVQPVRDLARNRQMSDAVQQQTLEKLLGEQIMRFREDAIRRAILAEGRDEENAARMRAALGGN